MRDKDWWKILPDARYFCPLPEPIKAPSLRQAFAAVRHASGFVETRQACSLLREAFKAIFSPPRLTPQMENFRQQIIEARDADQKRIDETNMHFLQYGPHAGYDWTRAPRSYDFRREDALSPWFRKNGIKLQPMDTAAWEAKRARREEIFRKTNLRFAD